MKGNEKLKCSKLIDLEKFSQVLDLLQRICMLHNKLRRNIRTLGSVITKICLSVAKLIKCFSDSGDVGDGWVGLLWSFSDQVAFPIAYFQLGLSFIMSS